MCSYDKAKEVVFTKHAEDMLQERGFSRDLIVDVVLHPDWSSPGEGEIWYAFKRMGNKVLRVVVKGKEKPFVVITMYFDRRLRRR